MATGSRFLPLDPEGRDEGDADAAAKYHHHDDDAAAVLGVQPHDDANPPHPVQLLRPIHHLRLARPLGRLFLILGTAAAAAAASALFPCMLQVPGRNLHSMDAPAFVADTAPGVVPDLLQQPVWANIPRGGTSTTAVSWVSASVPDSMSVEMEEIPEENLQVTSDTSLSSGIVPNLLKDQSLWANIPRGGTSNAVLWTSSMNTFSLAQLMPASVPDSMSVEMEEIPKENLQVTSDTSLSSASIPDSMAVQMEEGAKENQLISSEKSLSSGVEPILLDHQPLWMNIPRGGTSAAVPSASGILASAPGPGSAALGPWSATWVSGTVYFFSCFVVMVLVLAATAIMLLES